jgi:hypothetical protein
VATAAVDYHHHHQQLAAITSSYNSQQKIFKNKKLRSTNEDNHISCQD